MRLAFIICLFLVCITNVWAQLEITTGYAVNKELADGAPIQVAYDIKIKNRLFTKPQIGFKYLYHFEDFAGVTMKVRI